MSEDDAMDAPVSWSDEIGQQRGNALQWASNVRSIPMAGSNRAIWVIAFTCIFLFAVLLSGQVYNQRNAIFAEVKVADNRLTIAMASHVRTTFALIDLNLKKLVKSAPHLRTFEPFKADIAQRMAPFVEGMDMLHSSVLVNREGASTHGAFKNEQGQLVSASRSMDSTKREYFKHFADLARAGMLTDHMHISKPIKGRISGAWLLTISRAIFDEQNQFDGIAALTVNMASLNELFEAFELDPGDAAALIRDDGYILGRSPLDESLFGQSLAHGPLFTTHLPRSRSGYFEAQPITDGRTRLVTYVGLAQLPLVVTMARDKANVLQAWLVEAMMLFVTWLGVSALILILARALVSQRLKATRLDQIVRQSHQVAAIGGMSMNLDSGQCEWTDQLFSLLGLKPHDVQPSCNAFLNSVHPQDQAHIQGVLSNLSVGDTFDEMFRVQHRSGLIKWVRGIGEVFADDALRAGYMIGAFQDVSVHKENEQALLSAKIEAESANQTKSEFLANMSHELRTPLNAILGFSDVIMCQIFGKVGHEKYEEYARSIHESGNHLLAVINDILDLSKVEADALELDESVVDFAVLAHQAVDLIAGRAAKGGVHVELDIHKPLPGLLCDQRRMRQILLNLMSNAVKFTKPGGTVSLCARLGSKGQFVVEVKDNGIGMTPEELKTALSLFGQVESSQTRSHEGTGLGLPLTKALVEKQGGTLTIKSFKDQGTEVRIEFPQDRLRAL